MSNVRYRFKLVLVGEGAVGKTSIRQKYMGKSFSGEYLKTIGADFSSKVIEMKDINDEPIKSIFQIWDLAGQVTFKEVRAAFYGGCQGVLLVFDLTRKNTMDKLKDWILEAAKNAGGTIKAFYLIGNKSDLPNREIKSEEGLEFAKYLNEKLKFPVPYIETSAKTGENIDYLFENFCRIFLISEGLEIPKIPKQAEQIPETAEEVEELTEEVEELTEDVDQFPVLSVSSTPEEPEDPKDAITSPALYRNDELAERVSNIENKITQIEKYLKKITDFLKNLIK